MVLYPGSFDPPTVGHLSIIRRASALFDRVVVLVAVNPGKHGVLGVEDRAALMKTCTADLPNVTVEIGRGLLLDACHRFGASAILRGLREEPDYQAERPVADAFLRLYGVETLFMQCEPTLGFVSSSMARELLGLGGNADGLIPPQIKDAVKAAYH